MGPAVRAPRPTTRDFRPRSAVTTTASTTTVRCAGSVICASLPSLERRALHRIQPGIDAIARDESAGPPTVRSASPT